MLTALVPPARLASATSTATAHEASCVITESARLVRMTGTRAVSSSTLPARRIFT